MFYRILFFLFFASIASAAQVNSLQDKPSFVCHLNDNTGTTVVVSTGWTNGTTNGSWVTGRFGSAIYHTGAGNQTTGLNYTHISDHILVNGWYRITSGGSVARSGRWYNPNGATHDGWFIQMDASAGKNQISGGVGNNGASYREIDSGYIYNFDTWYFVSMWFSSNAGKPVFFVNGKAMPIGTDNATAVTTMSTNSTENVVLGAWTLDGTTYYSTGASYDDFSIYGNITTLSKAQALVKQLYTQGRGQND